MLSIAAAARELGCAQSTVRRLVQDGQLEAFRTSETGTRIAVSADSVHRLRETRRVIPTCKHCAAPLSIQPRAGRPALYCSATCRRAASRATSQPPGVWIDPNGDAFAVAR